MILKRFQHTTVYGSIIQKSQEVEETQKCINW